MDVTLLSRDLDMAENKHEKPGAEDGVSKDTEELFDKLYRNELDGLEDEQQEAAHKPGTKASGVLKKKVVYQPKVEASKKISAKTNAAKRKVIKKRPTSAVGRDAPEEVSPNKAAKIKEIEIDETGSQPKIGGGSDKIKIALLCVVLVATLAFIINSLGIVDFGGLLGFSEPPKKERIKPRVTKKPTTKTEKKTTRVAMKKPQKNRTHQAPNQAAPRKRAHIAKKPPQVSPSKAQPLSVRKSPALTTPAEEPVITQQRYRPVTPTKEHPAVQEPSKPAAPQQRPVASAQEPALTPGPSKSMTLSARPAVAKKPPQPAISKAKPATVQETLKPATHNQEKEVSTIAEFPREERIDTYPYSVYLGSYPSRKRTDKAISGYRKKGLHPYRVKVDLRDKGVWYRVFAGRYKSREEAEAVIKEKGLVDAEVKKTENAIPTSVFLTKDESAEKKGFKEEERPPKATALSYPYSIYLGSYRTIESVEKAISPYHQKGFSPYWVKVDLGDKGVWYRVFMGHFENKENAEQFIKKQQLSDAKVKKPRYANFVGTYTSEEELKAKEFALSALGYRPYVIIGVNGESLLYTGAFYQKGRAEKQRAELAAKGIKSQVVER